MLFFFFYANIDIDEIYASLVELVDTLVLGTSALRRKGSSPLWGKTVLFNHSTFSTLACFCLNFVRKLREFYSSFFYLNKEISLSFSPSRTWTYDQSVNSRSLYHWATEDINLLYRIFLFLKTIDAELCSPRTWRSLPHGDYETNSDNEIQTEF